METPKIIKYPNKILRTVCEPVTSDEIEYLTNLLMHVFTQPNVHATGLAANQIGISKAIFLYDAGEGKRAMVNPVLLDASEDKILEKEGCLSLPALWTPIARHQTITVEWTDVDNETRISTYRDYEAKIIQHEIDHLNAKIILDRKRK